MADFKLYEINELLEDALCICKEYAEKDEGVIPDDWSVFLDDVQMARDAKALDVARYVKTLRAKSEAIKSEKISLESRQRSLSGEADRLEGYLACLMKIGEKLQDSNTAILWRKSTSVEILDEEQIPDCYFEHKRIPVKSEIKKALLAGENIGARLVDKQNIQIK
jgi:hypothetical protein